MMTKKFYENVRKQFFNMCWDYTINIHPDYLAIKGKLLPHEAMVKVLFLDPILRYKLDNELSSFDRFKAYYHPLNTMEDVWAEILYNLENYLSNPEILSKDHQEFFKQISPYFDLTHLHGSSKRSRDELRFTLFQDIRSLLIKYHQALDPEHPFQYLKGDYSPLRDAAGRFLK